MLIVIAQRGAIDAPAAHVGPRSVAPFALPSAAASRTLHISGLLLRARTARGVEVDPAAAAAAAVASAAAAASASATSASLAEAAIAATASAMAAATAAERAPLAVFERVELQLRDDGGEQWVPLGTNAALAAAVTADSGGSGVAEVPFADDGVGGVAAWVHARQEGVTLVVRVTATRPTQPLAGRGGSVRTMAAGSFRRSRTRSSVNADDGLVDGGYDELPELPSIYGRLALPRIGLSILGVDEELLCAERSAFASPTRPRLPPNQPAFAFPISPRPRAGPLLPILPFLPSRHHAHRPPTPSHASHPLRRLPAADLAMRSYLSASDLAVDVALSTAPSAGAQALADGGGDGGGGGGGPQGARALARVAEVAVEVRLGSAQLDNQMRRAAFPTVLALRAPVAKAAEVGPTSGAAGAAGAQVPSALADGEEGGSAPTAVEMSLILRLPKDARGATPGARDAGPGDEFGGGHAARVRAGRSDSGVRWWRCARVLVRAVHVQLEPALVEALLLHAHVAQLRQLSERVAALSRASAAAGGGGAGRLPLATRTGRHFLERAEMSPVLISLAFRPSRGGSRLDTSSLRASALRDAAGLLRLLPEIQPTTLRIDGLSASRLLETAPGLLGRVGAHAKAELSRQAHRVLLQASPPPPPFTTTSPPPTHAHTHTHTQRAAHGARTRRSPGERRAPSRPPSSPRLPTSRPPSSPRLPTSRPPSSPRLPTSRPPRPSNRRSALPS